MMPDSAFNFSWELIGDLQAGRPRLGATMRVEAYRLMLFCLRDVLARKYGVDETKRLLYEAGVIAGWEFSEHVLGEMTDLPSFMTKLQSACREMGIGVVEFEQIDPRGDEFVLTVTEDLDCSGLPDTGTQICQFDEGFIAALLEYATEQKYTVREVDCWASGARVCRFHARKITSG